MANWFNLILDTLGPQGVTLSINSGAAYTNDQLVTLSIGCSDPDKTGYQMKIWGNVDTAYDTNIQATEGASTWITYAASKQIKLATGDGTKTVYVKIRDDVWNESAQASDSITLDTTVPVVTITGPDVGKVSKVASKDTAAFSFSVDQAFVEYKVKVVPSTSSLHTAGTQIPTTAGSTNMSGSGSFEASTPIASTIKGADLETASAGDGTKIIKTFVKDAAGNWSV